MPDETGQPVRICYTNHRGETSLRRIIPLRIRFGSSDWHPHEQWFMDAYDFDRGAERTFALNDLRGWFPDDAPR